MNLLPLRKLLLVALVGTAGLALAQAPDPTCQPPEHDGNPLAARADLLRAFERLPQHCLRDIVKACTAAADTMLLDQGSAAACSLGYEALLKQGFGGNFQALMAWWRSERASARP
jgi:hypothetical protein